MNYSVRCNKKLICLWQLFKYCINNNIASYTSVPILICSLFNLFLIPRYDCYLILFGLASDYKNMEIFHAMKRIYYALGFCEFTMYNGEMHHGYWRTDIEKHEVEFKWKLSISQPKITAVNYVKSI